MFWWMGSRMRVKTIVLMLAGLTGRSLNQRDLFLRFLLGALALELYAEKSIQCPTIAVSQSLRTGSISVDVKRLLKIQISTNAATTIKDQNKSEL